MRTYFIHLACLTLIVCFTGIAYSQTEAEKKEAILKTRKYVIEIASRSYPEIKLHKIRIKTFESDSIFFKARFSFGRFFTFRRMRHLIFVNPQVFEKKAPDSAIKAILAHELAHISYYTRKNRFELLGLARLVSDGFIANFERKADIEAIARGFGSGLIEYRKWLYKNIPAKSVKEKKRNYFSPEEVKVILEVLRANPTAIDVWRKRVPRNIEEIKKGV